jgi:hypothetical protein
MRRHSKTKRRRKRLRKILNRSRRRALLERDPDPDKARVRRSFNAKARKGDAVEVSFVFDRAEVPVDTSAEDFVDEARRRTVAVEAWDDADNPTTGDG